MGRLRKTRNSVFRSILLQQYDESIKYKLYRSVKESEDWVQRLGLLKILPVHSGCVNCICWNERGDYLLSGSDDQHLVISHAYNYKVLTNFKTSHKANIFSAKFLPCTNDTGIVSCSGDGMILYTDLSRLGESYNIFNCHVGTTYEVQTIPNEPHIFLSCGEDTTVRSFDLRTKEKCVKARCMDLCNEDILISCERAVTALTVNSVAPHQVAIGCSDSTVRLYDRRMMHKGGNHLSKPLMSYIAPGMEGRSYRITSLSFSPYGEDILASYSSEHLYLFGVKNGETNTLSTEVSTVGEGETGPVAEGETSSAPVRRLRLRGDWSDTGPDARPQNYPPPVDLPEKKGSDSEGVGRRLDRLGIGGAGQARPTLHGNLMQRMTDVLSRMLNDPATRAALSHGGEALPTQGTTPGSYQGGISEGEEGEEEEEEEGGNSREPADLPLPSFSSSFTQAAQETEQASESMEVEPGPLPVVPAKSEVAPAIPEVKAQMASTSSSCTASTSTSENKPNISHLNELSTMYHGFVEKTGVEPMVNLMYSDVGSTASCISVFVKDDKSSLSSDAVSTESRVPVDEANAQPQRLSEEGGNEAGRPCETLPQPRPSTSDGDSLQRSESCELAVDGAPSDPLRGEAYSEAESQSGDEDSAADSEPDVARSLQYRLMHPIERHMEDAIKNMSSKKSDSSNTRKSCLKQKYVGHRNARTMIKEATFWGNEYVISGSDCGHVFMWEKDGGRLRMLLEADHHVVNCVQPHPTLPILATSGIDYDVKLWAPVHSQSAFQQDVADELMKRNAVMLEETKDTITVPASFMIRMLACLNQLRRGGRSRQQRRDSSTNSD